MPTHRTDSTPKGAIQCPRQGGRHRQYGHCEHALASTSTTKRGSARHSKTAKADVAASPLSFLSAQEAFLQTAPVALVGKKIALSVVATHCLQQVKLLLRLDAFGNRLQAELMCHQYHGLGNRTVSLIAGHVANERVLSR